MFTVMLQTGSQRTPGMHHTFWITGGTRGKQYQCRIICSQQQTVGHVGCLQATLTRIDHWHLQALGWHGTIRRNQHSCRLNKIDHRGKFTTR